MESKPLGGMLPLTKIHPSKTNPRKKFDDAKLEELAQSIRKHGVLEPILVRPFVPGGALQLSELSVGGPKTDKKFREACLSQSIDTLDELIRRVEEMGGARTLALEKLLGAERGFANEICEALYEFEEEARKTHGFELVAGERRFRAAQLAGLAEIPAIIKPLTDLEALEIQVIENEQREDLGPLEKADGYALLVEKHGQRVEDLAAKVGKSAATIYGLLKLRKLPEIARKALDAGELAPTTAQLLARIPNEKQRAEVTKYALAPDRWEKDLPSFREVKDHIEHRYMIELKQAPFNQMDSRLVPAAGPCDSCPKKTGNNRLEYPEGRADVCTDPACYRQKVEAHKKTFLARAKAEGKKVLSDAESKKLFPNEFGGLTYGSIYVDFAENEYVDGKSKSWKQICAGELDDKIVLAADRKGVVHELVPKAAAQAKLRSFKAKKAKASANGHANGKPKADPWKAQQERRRAQEELRRQTGSIAIAGIVADCELDNSLCKDDDFWRLAATCLIENGFDDVEEICRRRGFLTTKQFGWVGDLLAKEAEKMTPAQIRGLVVELLITSQLTANGSKDKTRKAICDFFGVDWKETEKLTRSLAKQSAKPSANGHANTKPHKNGKAPPPSETLDEAEELAEADA